MLTYLLDSAENGSIQIVLRKAERHLSKKLRGDAMTIADQLREEGKFEGIQLFAGRLFESGMDIEEIAARTGMDIDYLESLLEDTVLLD